MTDEKMIATTDFLRQVNYYWFMMNFKIGDPGTTYQYIGQDTVDEKVYDKVSIAYDPQKQVRKLMTLIFYMLIPKPS